MACALKFPQDAWDQRSCRDRRWRCRRSHRSLAFTKFRLQRLRPARTRKRAGRDVALRIESLDLLSVGRALHSRTDEREHRARFAARRDGRDRRKRQETASRSSANSFSVAIPKNVFSTKVAGTKDSIFTPVKREDDKQQFQKFNAEVDRWISWRDGRGRRAFTLPVSACSDDAEVTALDRISMGEWMNQRGLTSPRLRWWVDYACRDDYGMTLDQTSAWAGLFYFCSRVTTPGVESQSLITWPEGNGRLVHHLFEKAKAKVQLDRAAVELIPVHEQGGIGVDVITLDREGRNPRGFHAKRVIFAAPQFMARYVVRPYRDNPPPHIAEFQFGAWMVANLTLKDRPNPSSPRDFPLAWDNVLYESPSLGYVVATHQRGTRPWSNCLHLLLSAL